jgi:hypothetical protein
MKPTTLEIAANNSGDVVAEKKRIALALLKGQTGNQGAIL